MGMLLHRHLAAKGVVKPTPQPAKVTEELKEKDKANDVKRKNSNNKNISK